MGPLDGKPGRPKNAKFNHDGSVPHLRPSDKLFSGYLRCAVTIFGSEAIIFRMQLHLPYIFWDSFQYAYAAFKIIGIIHFMQLQFWRFSELILRKFLEGGYYPRPKSELHCKTPPCQHFCKQKWAFCKQLCSSQAYEREYCLKNGQICLLKVPYRNPF